MTIQTIIRALEEVAPPLYQESYDNAGLIVGDPQTEVTGAVLCLDAIEAVIDEAIERGCNLVIAHHPIVFKGLKRFNGKNYVERTVMKAIRHDVAIYAAHTNLDNVLNQGVNARIAQRLGLQQTGILAPKAVWKKMYWTLPESDRPRVEAALAGFSGIRAQWSATGAADALSLSLTCPAGRQNDLQAALSNFGQPEVQALENPTPDIGSGLIGQLPHPLPEIDFLKQVKETMQTAVVRHTRLLGKEVQTVALCGGAGSFLLPQAIARGADVFITGDYKYHEFFDADARILIADIGHFESEQFTIELFYEILSGKFPNFALHCTKVNTNPVQYLV
jgi:dinuclear metal center YbgI/SA1388 family protein